MSQTILVRAGHDGDEFHYLWAARRCLFLIPPSSHLKAITIEGPSLSEVEKDDRITKGEELLDVSEYYGDESIERASLIRYIQLKHSTVRTDKPWKPSELEKTIKGFAERYQALLKSLPSTDLDHKLEFWFISNRQINESFHKAIKNAANSVTAGNTTNYRKLEKFTGLEGQQLTAFCNLLHLEGDHEGLWDQQNLLSQDVGCYLVGADVDGPVQLKELVRNKALTKSADNPSITRMDVLRALKTDESRLFPAKCLIENVETAVPRKQELKLIEEIVKAKNTPTIVHAAAGVGKSVFSTRISQGLPPGSLCALYDCFGNGQYRNASEYRHRHKDALVQISNELAQQSLCHPLIPSHNADPSDYVRAFLYRLKQSIDSLRSKSRQALICVIIDAADNAQMAAEEIGEAHSFVRDLIRERLPKGVRLVTLCRTHRQDYLDPPPYTLKLELLPFSRNETANHLRQVFNNATDQDVDEFHRLSSHNPRVQALALSWNNPLDVTLRALGPNPTTVEKTIRNLLDTSIKRVQDSAGAAEKVDLNKICEGLAVLRPLIPLSVLASISRVSEAAIKSFAIDFGRPLRVIDDSIQFTDEPTETWFRDRFKPTDRSLYNFIKILKPLAASSSYVASTLPQLMLEAGRFSELVDLALYSQALPSTNPVEKRDVELQRLQFALKASLRAKRYCEAAKLALKAGGECAGDARQRAGFQANTDLVAVFLEGDRIQELVSRRTFGSGWVGSHHAYEAALLSGRRDFLGDARSRLRMAREWLQNWSRLPEKERENETISDDDIVEIATALFNIHGADRCAYYLRGLSPLDLSFDVGRTLSSRFIDHGRYNDLKDLSIAAGNNLCLIMAIALELRKVHRTPPKSVVERALKLVLSPRIKLKDGNQWYRRGNTVRAVTALVEVAHRLLVGTTKELVAILTRYLPETPQRDLASRHSDIRFSLLRMYALRAALNGQNLELIDLAHDELRKELENQDQYSESRDAREFKADINDLLPWYKLWAETLVGQTTHAYRLDSITIMKPKSSDTNRPVSWGALRITNEIARIWFDILLAAKGAETEMVGEFDQWLKDLKRPLYTTTLTHLSRLAGRSSMPAQALSYAAKAFDLTKDERDQADSKSDTYVKLARAVLIASESEAAAYFNQAVEVASKIGDENFDRWEAILDLADRAASREEPEPVIAYRLARCSEMIYDYVDRDKHFDWKAVVEAISGLCGKSSFAILSRWRDRNFGSTQRILPIAVNFLIARGDLDPKDALALIGFRARWNIPGLLKSAITACSNKSEMENATIFAYRYMALEGQTASEWRALKDVLDVNKMTLPGLEKRIEFGQRKTESSTSNTETHDIDYNIDRKSREKGDWNAIFNDVDLCETNDIAQALEMLNSHKGPNTYSHERFFEEACRRVQVGKEAEFITALTDVTTINLYHLRSFFEKLPPSWKNRLAVRSALATTLKVFCQRFCMGIRKSRYYTTLPFESVCSLSGIPEEEFAEIVLTAIGQSSEIAAAGRYFTLIGLLVLKLSKNEALETLSFGLDLLDPVMEDTDGDGPWSSERIAPSEIEGSVAGYIWSYLGAPRTSLRWEAAHVVNSLCMLERRKIIKHLFELAKGTFPRAFYDRRFRFYEMHARQWFLIGIAHAVQNHPETIAPYSDYFIKIALTGEPHVLMRGFAKRIILSLKNAGLLQRQPDLWEQISNVNKSPFPFVELETYNHRENIANDKESDDDEDRFYFGTDIGPYWFSPLASCFSKWENIKREALSIIRNDWQISTSSRWDSDERHRRGIFRDMETEHSHGGYPGVDDQRFYLSYHAMMVVAGKLLSKTPVFYDPDYSEDKFTNWLGRHGLTRTDGGWLSDRRDPTPLERPEWKNEKDTDNWRWSINKDDFDRNLTRPGDRINLWGYWNWISGHQEETIRVSSALVSTDRSHALLRALQSVENPHRYRLPDVDDDAEIDFGGFRLKSWIVDQSNDRGIDEQDPWAGVIYYPAPEPAPYVMNLMKLRTDAEHRKWFTQSDHIDVAWSQVWGYYQDDSENDYGGEKGARFQASFSFIVSFLRKIEMDLIVDVKIERRQRYYRSERRNDNDIGFVPPSARLFLIRSDGTIRTL